MFRTMLSRRSMGFKLRSQSSITRAAQLTDAEIATMDPAALAEHGLAENGKRVPRMWRQFHWDLPAGDGIMTKEKMRLAKLEKGHWKDIPREDKIMLYKNEFGLSGAQYGMNYGPLFKSMFIYSFGALAISCLAYYVTRAIVGPKASTHTKEWREARKEVYAKYDPNPIFPETSIFR